MGYFVQLTYQCIDVYSQCTHQLLVECEEDDTFDDFYSFRNVRSVFLQGRRYLSLHNVQSYRLTPVLCRYDGHIARITLPLRCFMG